MFHTMDLSDAVLVDSSRLKSVVWNDFDKVRKGDTFVAICRHCKRKLSGSSASGTSHLRNHLIRCKRRSNHGVAHFSKRQKKLEHSLALATVNVDQRLRDEPQPLSVIDGRVELQMVTGGTLAVASTNLDQKRSQCDLARMIILHGYPLGITEHVGFRDFVQNLQPLFELESPDKVQDDCMRIYAEEKQKVHELLDTLPGKICLAASEWAASATDRYMSLTACYIDESWKLKKKMLSFIPVDPSQTEEMRSESVISCVVDWDIDCKLFSLTSRSISANDYIVDIIWDRLSQNGLLSCNRKFFDVCCAVNLVNLMVQDVLNSAAGMVQKIRQNVRYVKKSEVTLAKFSEMAKLAEVQSEKCICLDNPTRWDSTYLMLQGAFKFKKAFSLLKTQDSHCKTFLSAEEWERLGIIISCLKLFIEAINVFVKSKNPTANIFFSEICEIHLQLIVWSKNPDDFVSSMALKMKSKFDDYWYKCNLALAVAAILDPRFKMKLIEFYYLQLFGNGSAELIDEVCEHIKALHKEHSVATPSTSLDQGTSTTNQVGNSVQCASNSTTDSSDRLTGFDEFLNESVQSQGPKSDLDQYLEEPLFPRSLDFDVLNWWKVHTPKYPVLSMMARNILGIPMSIAADEFAFQHEGRVLNQDWGSLQPDTMQALMCSQDWLLSSELERVMF